MSSCFRRQQSLCILALGSTFLLEGVALGTNGPDVDPVPYNVIFVVDASSSMGDCLDGDMVDTDGNGSLDLCGSSSKMEAVKAALIEASETFDNVYLGLAQTDPSTSSAGIGSLPILTNPYIREGILAPLGSSTAVFQTGVNSMVLNTRDIVTSAESLRDVALYYIYGQVHCTDPVLCADSPIDFTCQAENHVVLITDGTSSTSFPGVDEVPLTQRGCGLKPPGNVTSTRNAYLDDIANCIAINDQATSVVGQQTTHTHVIALGQMSYWDNLLFQNTADVASATYQEVESSGELRGAIRVAMNTIMEGSYQPMPATLTVSGEKLFVGWHEAGNSRPMNYGNLLSYDIDMDPDSSKYGEIVTASLWRAHEILESRTVSAGEIRETTNGNNGEGIRDIYTNIDKDGVPDAFDAGNIGYLCGLILDDSVDGFIQGHDVNEDGYIDTLDCQEVVDFVRGSPLSEFLSTGTFRGASKLGSIRHSQVAVAEPNPDIFTRNPSLRTFIDQLPETLIDCPSPSKGLGYCEAHVAFVAANDGMLHAFNANTGDELWAYIPRPLLGQTVSDALEEGELFDLMWGEKLMMDATPRISYVWIDGYEGKGKVGSVDGIQTADEWVRAITIGQGGGGRYYLSLDITQPDKPYILWEDSSTNSGSTGMGATTSTASVGLVRNDKSDDWVAFYGSGQQITDEYINARLYIRSLGDVQGEAESYDDAGVSVAVDLDGNGVHDGVGFPSNPMVIDRDNDGDSDEVFLTSSSGALYKFVLDESNVDNTVGCLFFDPESANFDTGETGQTVAARTSSYYQATASINSVGEVLIYYGTGSPYDDFSTDRGYFYVLKDLPGCSEAQLFTKCDSNGVIGLEIGERLTGSPVVYDEVVYFTTYAPGTERCLLGEARLYGLDYQLCTAAFDTNASGTSGDGDALYYNLGKGVPSQLVIANDSIYVATTGSAGTPDLTKIDTPEQLTTGSVNIQWREIF